MRAVTSLEIGVHAPEREAVGDSGKGGRILVIDDCASSYERLASMLRAEHTVDIETDPSEALSRAPKAITISLSSRSGWKISTACGCAVNRAR